MQRFMKVTLPLLLALMVVLALAPEAQALITCDPLEYDFCNVQVGTSSTMIVTITNVNEQIASIEEIQLFGSIDFVITNAPPIGTFIPIEETA